MEPFAYAYFLKGSGAACLSFERPDPDRCGEIIPLFSEPPQVEGVLRLNDEQWAHFMQAMLNPSPPSPLMIQAAKDMREFAKSGKWPAGSES